MKNYGLDLSKCWFVDIPYSTNKTVRDALIELGCLKDQMAEHFNDPIAPYSRRQIERVENIVEKLLNSNKSRVLVIDDGAYFIRAINRLSRINYDIVKQFNYRKVSIVEQTTRGHRYLQTEQAKKMLEHLESSVVSIARTETKRLLESPFIGASVAQGMKKILIDMKNSSTALDKILIIGFGTVGRMTTREVKKMSEGSQIHVFDIDPELKPEIESMEVIALDEFPEDGYYTTVFGCTGYASFPIEKTRILSEDAILVSGSSAAVEFNREKMIDFAYLSDTDDFYILEPEKTRTKGIHATIKLSKDGKMFSFVNAGFPINFDGSIECVPYEIIQLIHGQLLAASIETLSRKPGFYQLNQEDDSWFQFYGLDEIKKYANK